MHYCIFVPKMEKKANVRPGEVEQEWRKVFMTSSARSSIAEFRRIPGRALLVVHWYGVYWAVKRKEVDEKFRNDLPSGVLPWYRRVRVPESPSKKNTKWSHRMKPIAFFLAVAFGLSAAGNGYLVYQNSRIGFMHDVEVKRGKINEDMIEEMMYTLRDKESSAQIARMEGYNEAINSLVHKIEPKENMASNIWHSGYYRGMEQVDFVGEMKFEQGYAQGFQKGTSENMKAIQTILRSGDNIKTAIEKFVESSIAQEKPSESKPSGK